MLHKNPPRDVRAIVKSIVALFYQTQCTCCIDRLLWDGTEGSVEGGGCGVDTVGDDVGEGGCERA